MTAAAAGWLHIVELLLVHGANIEARDLRGATALMHAASAGHPSITAALLDLGADVGAASVVSNCAACIEL